MNIIDCLSEINEACALIHAGNKEKGFWDTERNVGELLMLVTSELGEAMEAHRKGRFTNWDLFDEQDKIERKFGRQKEFNAFKSQVKDSFEDEIADAVIRLFDLSAGLRIDLERHIIEKLKYNSSRERLHGKRY